MMVLRRNLLHRIRLSLILHHLLSSEVITLVAYISYKFLFSVVASQVQWPVTWNQIYSIVLIRKCNLRGWRLWVIYIVVKSLLIVIWDPLALPRGINEVLAHVIVDGFVDIVVWVSILVWSVAHDHVSLILLYNLHSIADVDIAILALLIQLLQDWPHIVYSTKGL